MNKIENEQDEQSSIKLLTPGADDVFSEQNKRKIFTSKTDMCNYISMVRCSAAQFRMGYRGGVLVWELVYTCDGDES